MFLKESRPAIHHISAACWSTLEVQAANFLALRTRTRLQELSSRARPASHDERCQLLARASHSALHWSDNIHLPTPVERPGPCPSSSYLITASVDAEDRRKLRVRSHRIKTTVVGQTGEMVCPLWEPDKMIRSGPRQHCRTLAVIACVSLSVAAGVGVRADDRTAGTPTTSKPDEFKVVGMTTPSKTATLAAIMAARIARIYTEEGSTVSEGDTVVALADGVQAARTEIARAGAQSMCDVDLAHARWQHAQREWDRLRRLRGDDHASSKEPNDAQTDARTTQLEYEIALFNHEQASRTYDHEQRVLEEYRLSAPFTGYVVEHLKQTGETVDQLEGIVKLVQLDPLHVVVDCPITLAPYVLLDKRYWIQPSDYPTNQRVGTVVFASRMADGGSQTFRVKLEVPNRDQAWAAGLKVVVDFTVAVTTDAQAKPRDSGPVRSLNSEGGASGNGDRIAR